MSEAGIVMLILIAAWAYSIWYAYSLGHIRGIAAGLREARNMQEPKP